MSIKVLNLYAGIGGNRKLWTNVDVTAVEYNESIAKIYQDFYPDDKVIVADAHEYLLKNFDKFDFIWSSPPCPTHSKLRLINVHFGLNDVVYPDMALYQEIILLKHFCKVPFVVENVKGYYKPLVQPKESGRHYFWSNFYIPNIKTDHISIKNKVGITLQDRMNDVGFHIKNWHGYKCAHKERLLNNCVNPELGLHIFNSAMKLKSQKESNQYKLF